MSPARPPGGRISSSCLSLARQKQRQYATHLAADDRGVDLAAIEGIQQVTGVVEPDLDRERRVVGVQSRQQGWKLRSAHMGGDTESKAAAGMASGIDMSARMISLAVNIAMMGFILASGVLVHLKSAVPSVGAAELRLLAERISAGNALLPELGESTVHEALVNGFGWVMLYGGIGVWIMAAISFYVFNARPARREVRCAERS